MPTSPPRPCTTCHTLCRTRTGRCAACEQAWQHRRNTARAARGRYTATYQRNRRALLATNPPCHWCGNPATTADHIDGDNPHALVPACLTCNSRRTTRTHT